MGSAMYREESRTVNKEEYLKMRQKLSMQSKSGIERFTLRKLQFVGSMKTEGAPNFYLCVKNKDEEQIYLEKTYIQNKIYHEKCAKLTRQEYEKIYRCDIEWMKGHKNPLIAELYLQITINYLALGYLTEFQKEMIRVKKDYYITFSSKIERAVGCETGLFDEPEMKISCLDEQKVLVVCKNMVNIPEMINNILQFQDEPSEELGFVF